MVKILMVLMKKADYQRKIKVSDKGQETLGNSVSMEANIVRRVARRGSNRWKVSGVSIRKYWM